MPKHHGLPYRHYVQGDKKLVSVRLPESLLKELEAIAKERGWTLTDVIATALDEYAQWERKVTKHRK